MVRRLLGVGFLLLGCACERPQTRPSFPSGGGQGQGTPGLSHLGPKAPQVVPLSVCEARGRAPLDAARRAYDEGHYDSALSCAAQATALEPDDPQAHSERAAALSALGRFDEAKLAYARALALDPDHLDALLGAAHLYGVSLPSTREDDELAELYAERGRKLAEESGDKSSQAEFALLSAMALNDLGEASQALSRAEHVLTFNGKNMDAVYERAVALFELCRFKEARAAFEKLLKDPEHAAHAHQHLGLVAERESRWADATVHFKKARQLAPQDFPEPQMLSKTDFEAAVRKAVKDLPNDMQRDLRGVPVSADELPRDDDLLSGDPPLSPTILGLFRGPPLSEPCASEGIAKGGAASCRSVVLYRRNLARAVTSQPELLEQIRVTLLHEVGHLRGEDDLELAARGLE